jgi:predicted ATPase
MLLFLDNCEHLLDTCAHLAEVLLRRCPDVRILATSRAPLRISGEQEHQVLPLDVPDARYVAYGDLAGFAAVRLFVERARDVQPDFAPSEALMAPVAEICRRLEGLQLAIELAAARVRLLPPPALFHRLDSRLGLLTGGPRDAPKRQQTLRSTIDWSYNLLATDEQALFRRLAVFSGGCTADAAERVCNPNGDLTTDVIDGVAALLDQSLLYREETNSGDLLINMLETLREYALERLTETEADVVRRAHAAFYLELAERSVQELVGSRQASWRSRLEREHDNLRAALTWTHEKEPEQLLRFAGAMGTFWNRSRLLTEGRTWLERALAADAGSVPARAVALAQAAEAAFHQRDDLRAAVLASESLTLYEHLGDQNGQAIALTMVGTTEILQGNYAAARQCLEQGLGAARSGGDRSATSSALERLSALAMREGDSVTARKLEQERLALLRSIGDVSNITDSLRHLCIIATDLDDPEAGLFADQALAASRETGDQFCVTNATYAAAIVAARQDDWECARERFSACLAFHRKCGDRGMEAQVLHDLGWLALRQGDIAEACTSFAVSWVVWLEHHDLPGICQALDGAANLVAARGHLDRAARLVGAMEALASAVGHR